MDYPVDNSRTVFRSNGEKASFALLAIVLIVLLPLLLDPFRINMTAKYLSLAFAAVGLVLCWGYGGILSLGQGLFWGLGGYCMAAYLKLQSAALIAKDAGSDTAKALTTVGLPDFMDWNQITELPYIWYPFKSFPLTLICMFAVPAIIAWIVGLAIFKRRVSGVYFAIITQALAWIMEILFVTRQGLTGGINGITDLRVIFGCSLTSKTTQYVLYFLTVLLLLGAVLFCKFLISRKFGQMLIAIRDMENRVRFSGYDVSSFKIFVFVIAGMISAIGGAMFALNVGFMSPKLVTIEPSVYMVVFCALGGRLSPVGAVYGTLIVSYGRTFFSEQFPELWMFIMGAVFIVITVFCPMGLSGLIDEYLPGLWDHLAAKVRLPAPLLKFGTWCRNGKNNMRGDL